MASQGPNSAGTGATSQEGASGTYAWTNPSNITSQNATYASASVNAVTNTQYLKATNFGFSIPSGATIDGVYVEVYRYGDPTNSIADVDARLIIGGSFTGTNKLQAGRWSSTPAYVTYGGASDVWGTSVTYSDVNSSGFGFGLYCCRGGISKGNKVPYVDHIRITVYYTENTPKTLTGIGSTTGLASITL